MAEIVSRNSEEILPQFEEIIRLKNLFSPSEMREIIQRHVEYEYKSVRREKSVSDFQQYIEYKINFLKLTRIRMKVNHVNKKDKRRIENMLVKHINKLYNNMIKYRSTDISLWLNYIQFMTEEKYYAKAVVLYDSLLNFYLSDVELFIRAAKFMMKFVKDVDLARKILFKGIRIHKNNEQLYLELFKIELDFIARKRRQTPEDVEKLNNDPVLCGKTAEVVCFSALKVIYGLNFKISMLEICAKYKFAKVLQKKIYRILKTEHGHESEMWKRIALLQFNDINFENIDMTGLKSKDQFKQRVWRCFHVFLKAVKAVPTGDMWFCYIDTFFELLKSNPEKREFINKFLLKLLPRTKEQNLLKEEHYLCWVENTEKYQPLENLISFIDSAIKLYPGSAKLRLKKLQYYINQRDMEQFQKVFEEAYKSLKNERDQYLLWEFALQSCAEFNSSEISTFLENILKELLVTYPTLRILYLNWIISKNDVTIVRNIFKNISQIPPYNLELYRKMINIEIQQANIDIKEVRQLYEMACIYFGSKHTDLWLDYVKFEKDNGNTNLITNIYWKAVRQLDPALSDNFIAEYSIFKTTL